MRRIDSQSADKSIKRKQQRTFDKVARHLLTQAARSVDTKSGGCKYRGDFGLRCAVGALIPDSMYTPAMEGGSVYDLQVHAAVCRQGYCPEVAQDLQSVHDDVPPPLWVEALEGVAIRHGLNDAVLENCLDAFTEKLK